MHDGYATRRHTGLIRNHLEGSDDSPQRINVCNARYGPQRGTNDPVEYAAPFSQGQRLALDCEHVHFSERGRDRSHATGDAGRQVFCQAAQAFAHLLTRPVNVGAVLEVNRDIDQAILGDGAEDFGFRDAEHLDFNRHSNAAFDFFRGHPGRFHDDFDLRAGYVREGVDRQAAQSVPARAGHHQGRQQHKQALRQGKLNKAGKHYLLSFSFSHAPLSATTPLTATSSPALTGP